MGVMATSVVRHFPLVGDFVYAMDERAETLPDLKYLIIAVHDDMVRCQDFDTGLRTVNIRRSSLRQGSNEFDWFVD